MLKRKMFILFLALVFPLIGHADTGHAEQKDQVIVYVKGMTCPFCAHGVEKQLKKHSQVKSVDVSIKTGKTVINLKEGSQLSNKEIEKAVKNAGFSIKKSKSQE